MASAKRVCVAVSGGVDSLCALAILKRLGYDVVALHGLFGAMTENSVLERMVCACHKLDVELRVVDLRDSFQKMVIQPFASAWLSGLTPNPCASCNKKIKFGELLDYAVSMGADYLATGHYAGIVQNPCGKSVLLARGYDQRKDQSYFLSLLERAQLEKAIFPLDGLTKKDCRQLVANAGLIIPQQRESQDICFMAGLNREEFIKGNACARDSGPILLAGEWRDIENPGKLQVIGVHGGLWNYTEGQRKGLGIPYKSPLYVLVKDMRSNSLIVGPRSALGMAACSAAEINLLVDPARWPDNIFIQTRSTQKAEPGDVRLAEGRLVVNFLQPVFPSAPGQILAMYNREGLVLGAGIIDLISHDPLK